MPTEDVSDLLDAAGAKLGVRQFAAAEGLVDRAIAQAPQDPRAWCFRAIIAGETGRRDAALAAVREAVRLAPAAPGVINNAAGVLANCGDLVEAINLWQQLMGMCPRSPDALHNLAMAFAQIGAIESAEAHLRALLAAIPSHPTARSTLSNLLQDAQRAEEQATRHPPTMPGVVLDTALALANRGDLAGAIDQWRHLARTGAHAVEAHHNLGVSYVRLGAWDSAEAHFRAVLGLAPDRVDDYVNLANSAKNAGRIDEALALMREGIRRRKPGDLRDHDPMLYMMLFDPAASAEQIRDEHVAWGRAIEASIPAVTRHGNDRALDRPLRIGYVSPDFRAHVVGRNMLPLLRNHDHARFKIYCYANVARPDSVTEEFQKLADVWRPIRDRAPAEVARTVQDDQIDILVDLALHMENNCLRLFVHKPAPIQVTFAGYPGTTGLSRIDYRISDPYLDPPGCDESVYSEATLRLPRSFWCYDSIGIELAPGPLPAERTGTITFGCLNNFCKVNPQVLKLWARVLREVTNSRLLLLADVGRHREQTIEFLAREGIAGGRVAFANRCGHQQYLELCQEIDIGLDTVPYNAHTTALDCFWMGVPTVTLVGSTVAGRAGLSQLTNLGLTELIAHDADAFVATTVGLARDLPRLAQIRQALRQRMEASPLMDPKHFASGVEGLYREMWEKWVGGVQR